MNTFAKTLNSDNKRIVDDCRKSNVTLWCCSESILLSINIDWGVGTGQAHHKDQSDNWGRHALCAGVSLATVHTYLQILIVDG